MDDRAHIRIRIVSTNDEQSGKKSSEPESGNIAGLFLIMLVAGAIFACFLYSLAVR